MSEDRGWALYVRDMLDACERVLEYTAGIDEEAFLEDGRTYYATLHNLELIGEAATRIPDDIRASHPEVPWNRIISARNRIIHGYLGIDNELIWRMVSRSVPTLVPQLRALLRDEGA